MRGLIELIDIYDEIGYIKEVLEHGLSDKWERDATLLVRYYKTLGMKKSEVKKKLKDKCEKYVDGYNPYVTFKRLNKIIDNAWKKDVPLREIKSVELSKEVVDWFLNLENYRITDEEVEELKKRRPKLKISNKPMNFSRIKFLFTLYIWTKVQENYLEHPNMHYLKKYGKRFKEDADLKTSFSLQRERDLLFDLGFIYINFAQGIDVKFIDSNEVFKIPITDKNRAVLKGEDLYKCGYWLEKQRNGSFICENCGKEFANSSAVITKGRKRKYCKKCAKTVENDRVNEEFKTIVCIDCGNEVKIKLKDTKTCRCEDCQENFRRKYRAEKQRIYRNKDDVLTDQPQKFDPS